METAFGRFSILPGQPKIEAWAGGGLASRSAEIIGRIGVDGHSQAASVESSRRDCDRRRVCAQSLRRYQLLDLSQTARIGDYRQL